MLARTHTPIAPWRIVRADDTRVARLEIIKDLLTHVEYPKRNTRIRPADSNTVFAFDVAYVANGRLAG